MIKNPTLQTALPKTCAGFSVLHELRLESVTAHPRHKRTGKPTRRLKHHDLYKVRACLRDAFQEIVTSVN